MSADLKKDPEVIAIASGKGGTGKTLITGCLGYALRRADHVKSLSDEQRLGVSSAVPACRPGTSEPPKRGSEMRTLRGRPCPMNSTWLPSMDSPRAFAGK